jgi:hypothetical protein
LRIKKQETRLILPEHDGDDDDDDDNDDDEKNPNSHCNWEIIEGTSAFRKWIMPELTKGTKPRNGYAIS